MISFEDLPIDVKRELVYNAMQLTIACTALSQLTNSSLEYWATQICTKAYEDTQQMSDAKIDETIRAMELQRQQGYGPKKMNINLDRPKGFGK